MQKSVIKINDAYDIDLQKLIDSRLLVQANSGGGKSWLLRRLLEQSHGKVQQIIIDPEGEFASLREKYDYVLVGQDGDTPASPKSASLLAKRLLELNVSAIIDLYELHPQERKHFVRLFLESMINSPKQLHHPCIVVIDEAHIFAPEKGQSEAMDSVIGLASLGRKRGFCAVLATQRISKLNKDVAAECNNKLIGRTGLDIDRKRASEELGFTTKEQVLSLRTLDPGEFYAFGPAISNEVIKLKIGEVKTTHPKAGSRFKANPIPPTSRIKALLGKLADLPSEAKKEAETMDSLKRTIVELKKNSRQIIDPKQYTKNEEVQKIIQKATAELEKPFLHRIAGYEKTLQAIVKMAGGEIGKTALVLPPSKVVETFPIRTHNTSREEPLRYKDIQSMEVDSVRSASQQKILNSLMWMEQMGIAPADKSQVAIMSDQSPSSGGYFNNLGSLRSSGLIEYPTPGMVALTDAGRSSAELVDIPNTSEELHEQLFRKLSSSQASILKTLIEIYPNQISKNELAERVGQSPTSGGYFNNLGRLRSLKLVDYPQPGQVKARELLFLDL